MASSIPDNAFSYLFSQSTKLVDAGELTLYVRIGSLRVRSFQGTFYECVRLVCAPKLPSLKLCSGCYAELFSYCDSLQKAPTLPATNIVTLCYDEMFMGCNELTELTVHFSDWSPGSTVGTDPTYLWFENVSSTGTITCPSTLTDERGDSRIPTGWTKQDL